MKKTSLPLSLIVLRQAWGRSRLRTNHLPGACAQARAARLAGGRTLARGGRSRPRRDARRAPLPSSGRRRRLSRRGARARVRRGGPLFAKSETDSSRAFERWIWRAEVGGYVGRGRARAPARVDRGDGRYVHDPFTSALARDARSRPRRGPSRRARGPAGGPDGHSGLERASARASRFGPRRSGRRATSRLPRSRSAVATGARRDAPGDTLGRGARTGAPVVPRLSRTGPARICSPRWQRFFPSPDGASDFDAPRRARSRAGARRRAPRAPSAPSGVSSSGSPLPPPARSGSLPSRPRRPTAR